METNDISQNIHLCYIIYSINFETFSRRFSRKVQKLIDILL